VACFMLYRSDYDRLREMSGRTRRWVTWADIKRALSRCFLERAETSNDGGRGRPLDHGPTLNPTRILPARRDFRPGPRQRRR
jgi:hypothetical protein